MKTRRTRQYTSTGKRIFSTLNKTSKPVIYNNTNPQFAMTCQSRSNNGGRGCTNAGCGNQCCFLSFLVQNITFTDWMNDISGIGIGQTLSNSGIGHSVIGTITELVFPCACCQIPALIGDNSYNNFPLDMRILAKPASGSCVNSGFTGPNLYTAQAGDISGHPTTEEAYEVMGTSNVGAPYRNPIKGWRKSLADPSCCLVGTSNNVQTNGKWHSINNIYKDMHAKFTGKISQYTLGDTSVSTRDVSANVCYDFRIRSGMQPKPNICCSTGKFATKCNRDPNRCIDKNNYAYDYHQYLNNKSCKSFDRSQEKFFPIVNGVQATMGTCPTSCRTSSGSGTCCQRSEYRKSGCCPECMCVCIQKVIFGVTPPGDIHVGDSVTQTNNGNVATGTVVAITLSEGGNFGTMDVDVADCVNHPFEPYSDNNLITVEGWPHGTTSFTVTPPTMGGTDIKSCKTSISKTTWKPNNRKFSKQGAVTSSGRLERLKLDTIRTSNSKCIKGRRCRQIVAQSGNTTKTFLAPKGPYLAGRPRFTGWIYNARHPERVCMLTYRQQPFGIPQLTNRRRATRSNRLVNVNPNARGIVGVWQRGNTNPRAPSCKCVATGTTGCANSACPTCGTGQLAQNPGIPCCN